MVCLFPFKGRMGSPCLGDVINSSKSQKLILGGPRTGFITRFSRVRDKLRTQMKD